MTVLLNRDSNIIVQGFTGRIGTFHAEDAIKHGTNIVGGVTPGKGSTTHLGLPVFDTVAEAVAGVGADASLMFVPPAFAADSIMEAADAGLKFAVSIADGIPTQDMVAAKAYLRSLPAERRMRFVGPNCAGVISPGVGMMGIMPAHIYLQGRIGIVARSGTLSYEAAAQLKQHGLGVSTSVGIGGDPVNGSSFKDILELFQADPETDAVVLIGEVGGPQEHEAAEYIKSTMTKPVVAYIAGLSAPKGRRMGHAGAISAAGETAKDKTDALEAAGVAISPTPSDIGNTMVKLLKK